MRVTLLDSTHCAFHTDSDEGSNPQWWLICKNQVGNWIQDASDLIRHITKDLNLICQFKYDHANILDQFTLKYSVVWVCHSLYVNLIT